jgi:hypothetical protein
MIGCRSASARSRSFRRPVAVASNRASSCVSRAVRLRQVHAAADDRRARDHQPARSASAASGSTICRRRARRRDGVPALCALSAYDDLREHGVRAAQHRRRSAGDRASGSEAAQNRSRSSRCCSASPASCPAASASASRSAARSSRTPRRSCSTSRCPTSTPRLRVRTRVELARLHQQTARDHDLRHPRPGRGDDAGRPHRGDEMRAIEQIGTPMEIYGRPATEFVARFVGSPR